MSQTIAIVGGGLAGIAAAMRLAQDGCRPILIESRKRLGGRATSLVDPRTGHTIDNCQHVLLGCCTNLLDLYDRLGVADAIEWHRTLNWTRGRGVIDHVKAGRLPAPFHLARSFGRMQTLSAAHKRGIARTFWRMIRLRSAGRFRWRDRPFSAFLEACDQPDDVVAGFWNTIIVSACNLDVSRVSAAHALQVFQDGFLANRWSYTMGLSSVPLAALYDPAVHAVEQAGGQVLLGCSARAIAFDGRRITGVVTDDGLIECAAVISAVPFDRLEKLVSQAMRERDARLRSLDKFEVSPILGVHLRFDQPIMSLPHLILVDPPEGVQWLFNKGIDADGRQHVHAVISAADQWMALEEHEIARRVVADIHHALPNAIGLQPVDTRAIKEKRATFAATPGSDELRPAARPGFVGAGGGGIENLFLAGDWCDTGWPATMEGAVRSGYAAAEAITGNRCIVEDVPAGLLARLLGLR